MSFFALTGFVVYQIATADEINEKYENLVKQINNMDGSQSYTEMSALMKEISCGDKSQAKDYASLLRKITNNTYDFKDEEVFSTAETLSEILDSFAKGEITDGLQDIEVSTSNGKDAIRINFVDRVKYSISIINSETDLMPYGESTKKYDESLGNNLFKITVYSSTGKKWNDQYSEYCIYEIPFSDDNKNSGLKFLYYTSDSDSVVIVIGTNEVLNIQEQKNTELNKPTGVIVVDMEK